MDLKWKVVLPVAAYALALLALFGLAGLPGADFADGRWMAVAALAAGLVLLVVVVAVSVETNVRRPLAALARAAEVPSNLLLPADRPADEAFARIATSVGELQAKVERQQAELRVAKEARERADQALKLSEERLAMTLRGANDGLWERDLDRGRVTLSARWKSMLGYAEDEIADTLEAWRGRIHPDDVVGVEAALDAHLQGVTPRYECQMRLLHKDGRHRWMLSRGSAVRHANGRPYRMVGLDTDVSGIKRVEYVLAQVVEGTAGTYGEDFFRSLVRHFAAALEVPCAFISECADQPPSRVRTLAFWSAPRFLDSIEYDLPGSPCETVIRERRTVLHPSGLEAAFPVEAGFESYLGVPILGRDGRVLGHLAFLDQKAMGEEMILESVFRIFTARAAAELERKEIMGRLAQQFT